MKLIGSPEGQPIPYTIVSLRECLLESSVSMPYPSLINLWRNIVSSDQLTPLEERFLAAVHHHIDGWRTKVEGDFARESFDSEIQKLNSDPVYQKFGFNSAEYVLVRLMGRMSVSVGRRLGEIYDKIPRYLASARFDILPEQVAEKFNGLELDIGLRRNLLAHDDVSHMFSVVEKFGADPQTLQGVGIEIRYNFNPNDSARLRKDVDMANYLKEAGLFPVYLIYSSISPRDDAIARLTRAGWTFLQGPDAADFTTELLGADFLGIMERSSIRDRIHENIDQMMKSIFTSYAFSQVNLKL